MVLGDLGQVVTHLLKDRFFMQCMSSLSGHRETDGIVPQNVCGHYVSVVHNTHFSWLHYFKSKTCSHDR